MKQVHRKENKGTRCLQIRRPQILMMIHTDQYVSCSSVEYLIMYYDAVCVAPIIVADDTA